MTAITAVRGGICIVARADLRDAFSTFIHELTHIAYMVPLVEDENFLQLYPTAQDYVDKTFIVRGGELEANIQGFGALIRLNQSRDRLPREISESFDNQGRLVDRKKLSDYLLDRVGYRNLLRDNYREQIVQLYNLLATKEKLLAEVYDDRAIDSRKHLPANVHRLVTSSAHRLQSELIKLRELRQQFLSRMAAEGISLTTVK